MLIPTPTEQEIAKQLPEDPLGVENAADQSIQNIRYQFFSFIFGIVFAGISVNGIITFIIGFGIWLFIAQLIRRFLPQIWHMRLTFAWISWSISMIDFLNSVGMLLVIQFLLQFFMQSDVTRRLSWYEIATFMVIVMMNGFGVLTTIKALGRL